MMSCSLKKGVLVIFLFFIPPTESSSVLLPATTVVNGNVTIYFVGTCDGKIEWKHRQATGLKEYKEDSRLVAGHDQVTGFHTESGFEDRLKRVNESLYLSIVSVDFNDSGWFEVYCNGKFLHEGELNVLSPIEKFAYVGDSVTLPCHSLIDKLSKESEKYIEWTKNGHVLIVTAGNATYGPGFEGRVSVSMTGWRRGDLTLSLTSVHSSDQGTYLCSSRPNTDRQIGEPKAVTLIVEAKQSEVARHCVPFMVSLVVLLLVVSVLAVFFKFGLFQKCVQLFSLGKYCAGRLLQNLKLKCVKNSPL